MKLETITEKIFAKSDKELKDEIERAISPIASIIDNGEKSLYCIELRQLGSEQKVNGFGMLELMRATAFEGLRDRRRQAAVNEFMAQFEGFAQQLEWIKSNTGAE